MARLDMGLNKLAIVLEIYFCWSIHQVIALEKWKQINEKNLDNWFATIGYFEAMNSLANLSFNNPDWKFPVIGKENTIIEGTSIGHPLIPPSKRVTNDVKIDHLSEIMLVTGSNMAGKSTYLRSIGVNMVLAMCGASVCASWFCMTPMLVVSSMRITDNLAESTSTFYAELKKLKVIIDKVNKGDKIFILLDEILRGTNSIDRHTGSMALLKQLIKQKAVGIIATHDVELAELEKQYPENILNYHFDVQVNNEELYFDYKLKTGVCTSMNASILMKKIGITIS